MFLDISYNFFEEIKLLLVLQKIEVRAIQTPKKVPRRLRGSKMIWLFLMLWYTHNPNASGKCPITFGLFHFFKRKSEKAKKLISPCTTWMKKVLWYKKYRKATKVKESPFPPMSGMFYTSCILLLPFVRPCTFQIHRFWQPMYFVLIPKKFATYCTCSLFHSWGFWSTFYT